MFLSSDRTNEERTRYTGALCGLGWDSQTQDAILPEHDIELGFDVKFDVEDIIEVTVVIGDRSFMPNKAGRQINFCFLFSAF